MPPGRACPHRRCHQPIYLRRRGLRRSLLRTASSSPADRHRGAAVQSCSGATVGGGDRAALAAYVASGGPVISDSSSARPSAAAAATTDARSSTFAHRRSTTTSRGRTAAVMVRRTEPAPGAPIEAVDACHGGQHDDGERQVSWPERPDAVGHGDRSHLPFLVSAAGLPLVPWLLRGRRVPPERPWAPPAQRSPP